MKLVQVSRLACSSFIHDAFALGGDAPPTRSHTPLELEERLQSWDAGKRANIWITMSTIVAKCPGVAKKDFRATLKQILAARRSSVGFTPDTSDAILRTYLSLTGLLPVL